MWFSDSFSSACGRVLEHLWLRKQPCLHRASKIKGWSEKGHVRKRHEGKENQCCPCEHSCGFQVWSAQSPSFRGWGREWCCYQALEPCRQLCSPGAVLRTSQLLLSPQGIGAETQLPGRASLSRGAPAWGRGVQFQRTGLPSSILPRAAGRHYTEGRSCRRTQQRRWV